MNKDRTIILASGSPRRIEMMRENGFEPIIMPADIEENIPQHCSMTDTVMFLSLKKAQWVHEKIKNEDPELYAQGPVIIASDTIVYKDGYCDGVPSSSNKTCDASVSRKTRDGAAGIMGKPKDFEDGFRMLSALRNDVHFVVSGVAIIDVSTGIKNVFYDITKVFFKDYSDEELTEYLKTDEAYDKAGGYAIQGTFGKYIDHYEGSLSNVIGFPWERFEQEIMAFL